MNIISKKTLPPGGFSYVQPGFEKTPFPGMVGWQLQVQSILGFRRANKLPRATAVEVSEDLEEYTCRRLPSACNDEAQKKTGSRNGPSAAGPAGGGLASQIGRGITTIASWLGAGSKAVPSELSELRASVCVQCPYNKPASDFSMTGSVAAAVKAFAGFKNDLKLKTSHDDRLGVCEICGCHLETKVHVPNKIVMEGTPAGLLELFPKDFCWIRKEAESTAQQK